MPDGVSEVFTGGTISAPSCSSQLVWRGGEGRGKEGGSHALQAASCGGEKTNSDRTRECRTSITRDAGHV